VRFLKHESETERPRFGEGSAGSVELPPLGGFEQLRFYFLALAPGTADLEFRFVQPHRALVTGRIFAVSFIVAPKPDSVFPFVRLAH
jgi:hypothetical protein